MNISVIMGTYNGEEYIYEQLLSILRQSKKADEVIICDDCSSDKTVSIVNLFIEKYQLGAAWHVYSNKENLGFASNFYQGLKKASGDFIFFSDQDDVWNLNKIEEVSCVLHQNQNIKLLCTDFDLLISSDTPPKVNRASIKRMKKDNSLEKKELSKKNIHLDSLGCAMCIRKEFVNTILSYWFTDWAHDEFVWKMSVCAGGCYVLHKPLLQRRLHDHNVSMKKMHKKNIRENYLHNLLKGNEAVLQYLIDHKAEKKEIRLIERNISLAKLRIEMMDKCKLSSMIRLITYLPYYQYKRAYVREFLMAVRSRN